MVSKWRGSFLSICIQQALEPTDCFLPNPSLYTINDHYLICHMTLHKIYSCNSIIIYTKTQSDLPINKCPGDTQHSTFLLPLRINKWRLCRLFQWGSQYFICHIARMDTNKSTWKRILRKLTGRISGTADRENLKYS